MGAIEFAGILAILSPKFKWAIVRVSPIRQGLDFHYGSADIEIAALITGGFLSILKHLWLELPYFDRIPSHVGYIS
jgi:hypothetical protein